MNYVVHEVQHGILHVDRGFFFTIKELYTRPGDSIREYIEGKRVDHFKPLAFVLILSTIYAFLSHALGDKSSIENFILGVKSVPDSKGSKISYVAADWLVTHYAYTSLLLIPVYSLASYLSFIKFRYNYFQHLVLNAFVSGQATVFHIVYLFIPYFINKGSSNITLDYVLDYIEIAIGFILALWTYSRFFSGIKTWQNVVITILSYILNVIFSALCFLLVLLISKLLT